MSPKISGTCEGVPRLFPVHESLRYYPNIMPANLQPCSSCARHILSSEDSCPFCGESQARLAAPKRMLPKGRMSRAALVALGTLAVTPTVACGSESEDDSTEGDGDGDMSGDGDGDMSGDGDGDNPAAVYGAAPSGGTSGDGDVSGDGDGDTTAPVYGAAPSGGASGDGDMSGDGDGDTTAPVYGAAPSGGASGDGDTSTGGMSSGGTGGDDSMGAGGFQVGPVYGIAPIPPEN